MLRPKNEPFEMLNGDEQLRGESSIIRKPPTFFGPSYVPDSTPEKAARLAVRAIIEGADHLGLQDSQMEHADFVLEMLSRTIDYLTSFRFGLVYKPGTFEDFKAADTVVPKLEPTVYQLDFFQWEPSGEVIINVRLERMIQNRGFLWAIRGDGVTLTREGKWERESSPSWREDDFYEKFRFETAEEAITFWNSADFIESREDNVFRELEHYQGTVAAYGENHCEDRARREQQLMFLEPLAAALNAHRAARSSR